MNEEPNNAAQHEANKAERLSDRVKQQRQVPSIGRQVFYFAFGTPGGEYPAGTIRTARLRRSSVITTHLARSAWQCLILPASFSISTSNMGRASVDIGAGRFMCRLSPSRIRC
jgi:hypothetical protein